MFDFIFKSRGESLKQNRNNYFVLQHHIMVIVEPKNWQLHVVTFYCRTTLRESNVFSPVCLSACLFREVPIYADQFNAGGGGGGGVVFD